ncbi:MAG TPA: class I SAM-dependent DNA methyltransferase [Methanothrix sp.]|nr:class I SAM-dependent DNA methyltransferase [Methanothrix sp.]
MKSPKRNSPLRNGEEERETPGNNSEIEKRLWDGADELRANSKLKSSEYALPVLGLIFLKYADYRFTKAKKELEEIEGKSTGRRRTIGKTDYQARGVMYLPEEGRYSNLMKLPEGEDIGRKIREAMRAIEAENEDLKGVLPQSEYNRLDNLSLVSLLKNFNLREEILDADDDLFGDIYQYFLGKFAMSEGRRGGEFFTPTTVVKLIENVIQPFHGRVLDPACGSGGMFVQAAHFLKDHKKDPTSELSFFGQERVTETVRLCKMNLAVHGLSGQIKEANTYYEDVHESLGKFEFVMANPPFNVNNVDHDRIKDDRRFGQGIPNADNANYIWIQTFYSALSPKGRAGFVMANSASDARGSELEIRKKLILAKAVDVMIAVGSNFFYTVTLPCTLWFFDRGKKTADPARSEKVLFIDARHIYRQIDRAHREFTPDQIEFIANIARLYRGEEIETKEGSASMMKESFSDGVYRDVAGLCKVATIGEIEAQGWSLNPGRYVGVAEREDDGFDFAERLEELNEELERLNLEARELEERIGENVAMLLELD